MAYTNKEVAKYYRRYVSALGMRVEGVITQKISSYPVNISSHYDIHGNLNGLNLGLMVASRLETMLKEAPERAIEVAKQQRKKREKTIFVNAHRKEGKKPIRNPLDESRLFK